LVLQVVLDMAQVWREWCVAFAFVEWIRQHFSILNFYSGHIPMTHAMLALHQIKHETDSPLLQLSMEIGKKAESCLSHQVNGYRDALALVNPILDLCMQTGRMLGVPLRRSMFLKLRHVCYTVDGESVC
jgi:hypothetical protein